MTDDARNWWDQAVERNRVALLHVVAVLFVYAGLDEGGANAVPRHLWRMILRRLRPAESAVRRLIVVTARSIEVKPQKPRAEKEPTAIERLQAAGLLVIREGVDLGLARAPQPQPVAKPEKSASAIPAFPLADPSRRFDTRSWHGQRPFPQSGFLLADPDGPVSATRLCRRLKSLKNALDDIPGHAIRLARREARLAIAAKPAAHTPLRHGHPPGRHRKPAHPVDHILSECHDLALTLRRRPDTS